MATVVKHRITPDFNAMQNMETVTVSTVLKWDVQGATATPNGYYMEFTNGDITVTVQDTELQDVIYAYDFKEFDGMIRWAYEVRCDYNRIQRDIELFRQDDKSVLFCADDIKSHQRGIINLAESYAYFVGFRDDFQDKYSHDVCEKVYQLYALQLNLDTTDYELIPEELE